MKLIDMSWSRRIAMKIVFGLCLRRLSGTIRESEVRSEQEMEVKQSAKELVNDWEKMRMTLCFLFLLPR